MPIKKEGAFKDRTVEQQETDLYQAILKLKTVAECQAFFQDLCTPAEMIALCDRWRVAKLLDEEQLSYRDIHQKTGVSLATIGRVARFLTQEKYQGYRLVLDRIKKSNDSKNDSK